MNLLQIAAIAALKGEDAEAFCRRIHEATAMKKPAGERLRDVLGILAEVPEPAVGAEEAAPPEVPEPE